MVEPVLVMGGGLYTALQSGGSAPESSQVIGK